MAGGRKLIAWAEADIVKPTAQTWYIGAETIHNWRNRGGSGEAWSSGEWTVYFRDLPAAVKLAIGAAHDAHHSKGLDAAQAARDLCARFDCLIYG